MAYIVKGNPFTHAESSRASIAGRYVYGGCSWCGQSPRTLYAYNVSSEPIADEYGMRYPYSSLHLRTFCNRECARAFGIDC